MPPPATARTATPLWKRILKPFASLQASVVLFALASVLVFFATVAMMTKGLWTVVDEYFRSAVVWIPVDLVRKFGTVFLTDVGSFPKDGAAWPGKVPFPAGWTLGFLMLINLSAAHLLRFKLSWRRSGVILLHAGVVVLLVGELVTGLFAVESTMTIQKGETSNYLDVTREFEIAVTDPSDPATDRVTVVPHSRLRRPGVVSHPDLPFDLKVDEYWENTDKEDLLAEDVEKAGGDPNVLSISSLAPMIKGVRLKPRAEAAGVDGDARSDIPSVRVTVLEKETGKPLGTHLLSLWGYGNFEQNRRVYDFPKPTVTMNGVPYSLVLRNKRVYLPYTVELLDFEHGLYPGTEIHKDFASTVRVKDTPTGDAREARIWMNNPLRYADVSMYQHAVMASDSGTVLQVVANPGRLLPYLACTMITLGMLVHFSLTLGRFLGRPLPHAAPAAVATPARLRWLPWVVNAVLVLLPVGWFLMNLRTPKPTPQGVDLYAFGELPVRDGGRVMPLDTLARSTLQSISEYTEVKRLEGTQVVTTASAIKWLADVLDAPTGDWRGGPGAKHQVFLIEHHQVLAKLNLPPRPGFRRYSLEELRPGLPALVAEHNRVRAKKEEGKALDLYDGKIEDLAQKVAAYKRLATARDLQLVPPAGGGDWTTLAEADAKALKGISEDERGEVLDRLGRVERAVQERFLAEKREQFERWQKEFGDPENLPEHLRAKLRAEREALQDEIDHERDVIVREFVRTRRGASTPAGAFTAVLDAARQNDGERFSTSLDAYRTTHLGGVDPADRVKTKAEAYWLDHLSPFYYAEFLYGFAAVFALIGWLAWRPLNGSALGLMVFTFAVHTFALGMRVWIMGRPPVTNLYASAVFIGWGCVLLSLVVEMIYRNGVANLVGGLIGLITCKVAYFLGGSGDTMKMLQAVLDTNFWLTVHVLTVTAGYMGTFLAGTFAIVYLIGRGLIATWNWINPTARLDPVKIAFVPKMTYGVLCFALLLSFFGTVSGGIWADYSWGRFWGWDPKENGAVLIVLWNTLVLHARWCGLVKDRGVAVLAVAGNMVTAWSWFGTNQLQIGLHSYGFDNRLASGCFWFWVSQIGVMLLAVIPMPKTAPPLARRV